MIMWHLSIDQYVTPLDPPSSSVLPILISLPGARKACHICVYFPTAGLEDQFIAAVSELDSTLSSIKEQFGEDTFLFIKGDMNASRKNSRRFPLLQNIIKKYGLTSVSPFHPTYHHFLGFNGEFDSTLDVLIHSDCPAVQETLLEQVCRNVNPLVLSHHDLLVSAVVIPTCKEETDYSAYKAPTLKNNRVKILWSDEGVKSYKEFLGDQLDELAKRWLNSNSKSFMSVLLASTNEILNCAAVRTNKFIDQGRPLKPKLKLNQDILQLKK